MKRSITDCYKIIVERINRLTPNRLVELGYLDEKKLKYYFPELEVNDVLIFNYLYVLTSEGANGVLHILYFGSYLNERWLKDVWEEITGGARQLFIENIGISKTSVDEVTKYVINQSNVFGYVTGQSKYVRHAYSMNWVYRGWRSDFDKLKHFFHYEGYEKFPYHVIPNNFWKAWFDWLRLRKMKEFIQFDIDYWIEQHWTKSE
jgi:hypothetical protein